MKDTRILVVVKLSKYQWDLHRLRVTPRQLLANYRKQGLNLDRILHSDERQRRVAERAREIFPQATFASRQELTRRLASQAAVVFALGGDNHFQYVSHFLDHTPIIGVNSDPRTSEGSLTRFRLDDLERLAALVRLGAFKVEEWTRIQLALNGKVVPCLATSEIFLGESHRGSMSRHRLCWNGKLEEQKCSGLLVATGAGSSGWYDSACRRYFPRGRSFATTEKRLEFLVSEPFTGRLSLPKLTHGKISARGKLEVISLNDSEGVVLIDSQEQHRFGEGTRATLRVGPPLCVVKP
ncbi:MAG: NAD(+)/NADH kinase [Verrucomicrobiae bacterium]|nr:NAD(+)/NADH kinase [Verrucomicrobiae bacterium]